jgi:hypothetical protein
LKRDAYDDESFQGANTCAAVGSQNEAWPVPIRPAFAVEVIASAATITTPQRAFNPFLAADAATPSSSPLELVSLSPLGGLLHHPKGCFPEATIPRTRELRS